MNDMDTTKELIKEIWELWESMAECGELHIGPQFSANYKRLKAQVEQKLNSSGIGSKRLDERSEKIALLENFSTFLAANNYMDSDWRDEPPYAIDEFLKAACASGGEGKGVCDGCEDIAGFYLGTTCPKCNRPFRQVK